MIAALTPATWAENLYLVAGLVVAGVLLGLFLLNWAFDAFLD